MHTKVVAGVVVVLLVAAGAYYALKGPGVVDLGPEAAWVRFTPTDNRFAVMLPTAPEVTAEESVSNDGNPFTLTTYSSSMGTSAYYVIAYEYREAIDVSDPQVQLHSLLEAFASGVEGTVESSKDASQNTYPALDFLIKTGEERIQGRMVLAAARPYIAAHAYFPAQYKEADFNRFISSFEVR